MSVESKQQRSLFAEIASIVGDSGLLRGAEVGDRYLRDWSGDNVGVALAIARPRSTGEVAEVVRACSRAGVHIVPQGGNTGLVGGALPSATGGEIVVSLERMNAIGDVDTQNFSVQVQAGCILQVLREHVAELGFLFPLALGSQGSCQIGGAISTNAGGLNVLRYGMMRDLVLGLEVVLADGRIWNGLKALRKDNSGYDLRQAFLGAEGTLGIVTTANLKLFPAPTQIETAFLALDSADAVIRLYGDARRDLSDLLSAFELLTHESIAISGRTNPLADNSPAYVLMEVSASGLVDARGLLVTFLDKALGRGAVRDGTIAANMSQAASFWGIREAIIEEQLRRGRHLRTDVSVPISAVAGFMVGAELRVRALSSDAAVLAYGHVGDGNIHFNVLPPATLDEGGKVAFLRACEEAIFEETDKVGGSISAEHGIGRVKREAFLARISPVHKAMLSAVKNAFDPNGLLSPGRILEETGR